MRGEPVRYLPGHHRRRTAADYRVDENGCWVWLRYIGAGGYGSSSQNGKKVPAHRRYYELHKGKIPDGAHIDHLCSNRACVNPDHLEAVTPAENSRRGAKAKLCEGDIWEIRKADVTQRELAERYGVHIRHIQRIQARKSWA